MVGRANNSANAQEGWADLFMTHILNGYGIEIAPSANSDLRTGTIRWRHEIGGNNKRLDFVMRLYTGATIRDLTVGGRAFPSGSASEEEKKEYLRPITRTLLPAPDNLEFD